MAQVCFVESSYCAGNTYPRLFVWHHSTNEQSSCINVECALCEAHYTMLVQFHNGAVPEMIGHTILEAVNSIFYHIYIHDEE
jgi:hypothetical protein